MVLTAGEVEIVESVGVLDHLEMHGEALVLSGWTAPFAAVEFDEFEVALLDEPALQIESATRLPSPDVQQVHPGLHRADACRFRIVVRPSEQERARLADSLIAVTPRAGDRAGHTILGMLPGTLPMPEQELIDGVGGGPPSAFLSSSATFLMYGIRHGGLRPQDHVLDAGCGCGRMAYALTRYLGPQSRYEGFDVSARLVDWAARAVGSRFPNFRFQQVDLYNKMYNPRGALRASHFRFPYERNAFDYALLTSVFTHMFLPDIENYLEELYRVLRPGGRCLFTCFLIDEESRALMRSGQSTRNLVHRIGGGYAGSREVPEAEIGFDEALLLGSAAERGFEVVARYPGSWCGRRRYTAYQDMVVVRKPGGPEQRIAAPEEVRART